MSFPRCCINLEAAMDEGTMREVGRRILRRYRQNPRELPWRQESTPYRV